MIQQNYNVTDGVNFRADAERFTRKQYKKLTSCQLLDDAKQKHHLENFSVNALNDIRDRRKHGPKVLLQRSV